MNRCLQCLMPDTRPDTAFLNGVCSACLAYAGRPKIDWQAREEDLRALLARARAVATQFGNTYDVIVPSSGGKDSTAQVLMLKERGARVLAVTATTCHLTPIGRANLDNIARHASTVEVTPDRSVRAKLNRLGLELVGDISWPEHVAIFTTPFRVAAKAGIPFIFYGENPQNQYGGPLEAQDAQQMTRRWISEFGGFLGLRAADMVGQSGITEADMAAYTLPAGLEEAGIEAHFLGQYLPWDSHENAAKARAAGMRQERPSAANHWDHENLDNASTGLHDAMMWRKYGYGRGCAQVSVDIRAGRIDRKTALQWVEHFDGLFPTEYAGITIDAVLERIGMTMNDLLPILHRFTNWDLFQGEHDWRPILKEST